MNTNQKLSPGSNRGFGLVFATVFALISIYPQLYGGELRYWAAGLATIMLATALVVPQVLAGPNRIWFRFGLLLGHIVSPVVMTMVFVIAIIPTGLVLKMLRKDILGLTIGKDRETYWEPRTAQPGTMKNQY